MTTSILSVRMTDAERSLIEAAAENARVKISDFVRRKALEAAEAEMIERKAIEIPVDKWEEIEALMAEPARVIPAVQELSAFQPVWEK